MITGATTVEHEVGETGDSSTRKGERSIGSETTPGGEWNPVTCGGALVGTESKVYVIVQNLVYVNKQQGTRANLDQRAWNCVESWNDVGV